MKNHWLSQNDEYEIVEINLPYVISYTFVNSFGKILRLISFQLEIDNADRHNLQIGQKFKIEYTGRTYQGAFNTIVKIYRAILL